MLPQGLPVPIFLPLPLGEGRGEGKRGMRGSGEEMSAAKPPLRDRRKRLWIPA